MISKGDKIIFGIIALAVIMIFVFWKDVKAVTIGTAGTEKIEQGKKEKKKKKKADEDKTANIGSEVSILKKWELPPDLKEVSGIAYIDEQRFACIQDELGKIFIFNGLSGKIEKEIPFAGSGDYEGIAVNGNTAYVLRSDGKLFEADMNAANSRAKEYNTALTAKQNVEGLCYDKSNNRLLLAIKDDEPGNPGYKGIYAFDLSKKQFITEPFIKINIKNETPNNSGGKKQKSVMPSEIAINPVTNEIFLTDGPNSRLLVIDNKGSIKKLWQLGKEFGQPEGLSFSPQGEMFISNEGSKHPGNIIKVEAE